MGEGANLLQLWSLPPQLLSPAETETSSPRMQPSLATSISTVILALILVVLLSSKGSKVPSAFPKPSLG